MVNAYLLETADGVLLVDAGTPVLLGIKLRAPGLDKLVETFGLQQLIQTLIERMPRGTALASASARH